MKLRTKAVATAIVAVLPFASAMLMLGFWLPNMGRYLAIVASHPDPDDIHEWWFFAARVCDRWLWLWLPLSTLISGAAMMAVALYHGPSRRAAK